MAATAKFLFDRAFEGAPADGARHLTFDAFDDEPAYKATDLEAAKEEAYADGRLAGLAEAQAGIEAAAATALDRLATALDLLFQDREQTAASTRREAAAVAVATARALAPALAARFPGAEVEALLAEMLPQIHREPRLTVRVADPRLAVLVPRIEQIAADSGFGGRLEVAVDPELIGEDCRIEWSNGGVTRDRAATEALIDAALTRCFGISPAAGEGE